MNAIAFSSPIYYSNITSGMWALLERFLFSNSNYSLEVPTLYPKKIPSVFVYTMNVPEEHAKQIGYPEKLNYHENFIARVLGKPMEVLRKKAL